MKQNRTTPTTPTTKLAAITYEVEKNILLPHYVTRRGLFWREKAEKMQHADSVRVATRTEAASLARAIYLERAQPATRRLNDGTYRVWKFVKGLAIPTKEGK